jgi:hypothetical protein
MKNLGRIHDLIVDGSEPDVFSCSGPCSWGGDGATPEELVEKRLASGAYSPASWGCYYMITELSILAIYMNALC